VAGAQTAGGRFRRRESFGHVGVPKRRPWDNGSPCRAGLIGRNERAGFGRKSGYTTNHKTGRFLETYARITARRGDGRATWVGTGCRHGRPGGLRYDGLPEQLLFYLSNDRDGTSRGPPALQPSRAMSRMTKSRPRGGTPPNPYAPAVTRSCQKDTTRKNSGDHRVFRLMDEALNFLLQIVARTTRRMSDLFG